MLLKKICAITCCIAMSVSLLNFNVTADSALWFDRDIVYGNDSILWKGEDAFSDSVPVTRGETAAIVANLLGLVYSGNETYYSDVNNLYAGRLNTVSKLNIMSGYSDKTFQPQKLITRQELSVVAVKAYNAISSSPVSANIKEDAIDDFNEISDWAVQYVFEAMQLKAVNAKDKIFRPNDYATRAECLEAISKIANVKMFAYEKTVTKSEGNNIISDSDKNSDDTISDKITVNSDNVLNNRDMGKVTEVNSSTDPGKKYSVYQKAIINNQMGTSGFYIKARFDGSTAIKLYAARTTTIPESETSAPFAPSSYVRISDPDGNLVGFYDFTEIEGKFAVEMEPAVKKDGIWTFTFTGCRTNDVVEFGFDNAKSWGIGGMSSFMPTETTPKELFVYTQPMIKEFHVFTKGTGTLSVVNPKGKQIMPESFSSSWYDRKYVDSEAIGNSTYKIQLNGYRDVIAIDKAPSLMCPTKDMAMDLKGGWVESEGILTQGPLQARIHDLAVKIARTCDLEVDLDEIPPLPAKEDIENIMAEAQLFGKYAPISGVAETLSKQIIDPESPYLGYVTSKEVIEGTSKLNDYQEGNFTGINLSNLDALSGALIIPAQLNYFYNNEALMRRCELWLLSGIYTLSEDMFSRENSFSSGTTGTTHAGFYLKYTTHAYQLLKDSLPKEDVEVIEEAMIAFTDSQQNYRGYMTNQMQHASEALFNMYLATGLERYHEAWKRQIKTVIEPVKGWEHFGFNHEGGYFVENYGCDGNYSWLNEYFFNNMYRIYDRLETADRDICEAMRGVIKEYLTFESYAWLTNPLNCEADFPMASCFTSRTDSWFGHINGYPHIQRVMDIEPLAKRRHLLQYHNNEGSPYPSTVFPHLITNEDWAYKHIEEHYDKYHNYSTYNVQGWTNDLYQLFTDAYYGEGRDLEPAQLPCEGEDMIKEYEGFIAYKNKGIYGYTFYDTPHEWSLPGTAWMGGGPSVIWSEKTGGSLVSRKHTDYSNAANVNSADKVNSTCVFYKDTSGSFVVSGKERSTLTWIEPNKIWEISGKIPNTIQTVTWRYELTDKGIRIKISLTSAKGLDAWVNLPLFESKKGNTLKVEKYDGNSLDIGRGSDVMTYSWDAEKSTLSDPGSLRMLRLKFPSNGTVTVDISCR